MSRESTSVEATAADPPAAVFLKQRILSRLRIQPRRNSIPPTQTLTAKHLLAYLPRPQPDSLRYSPYKAAAKNTVVSLLTTKRVRLIHNMSYTNSLSLPPSSPTLNQDPDSQSSKALARQEPLHQYDVQAVAPLEAIEEIPKPSRPHRSRHLKRFSSRWQSRNSTASSNISAHSAEKGVKMKKQRCKLLDDENPSHVTTSSQRQRYITKDGKCRVNLGPIVDKSRFISDIFTTLVAFAVIYFFDAWLHSDVAHVHDPEWQPCYENADSFLSALLLSLESQRTIGYGSRMVTANCLEGVVLLMAQSILGCIIDALMVGCMFVKISRPQQRAQTLIFSKYCVICERDEKLCMLFRISDLRESHMVDAKIRAKLIKSRQTKEGEFIPLEQSEINLGYDTGGHRLLLVEPQTITHVINDSSPFWEVGAERLKRETFEIIVILEGIVEAS
ncbi:hypothetical protein LDENG_00276320, partial [Lucifuga dentata]